MWHVPLLLLWHNVWLGLVCMYGQKIFFSMFVCPRYWANLDFSNCVIMALVVC